MGDDDDNELAKSRVSERREEKAEDEPLSWSLQMEFGLDWESAGEP